MRTLTAKEAKYGFGWLFDLARAEPLIVAKHGRPFDVITFEKFDRLNAVEAGRARLGHLEI